MYITFCWAQNGTRRTFCPSIFTSIRFLTFTTVWFIWSCSPSLIKPHKTMNNDHTTYSYFGTFFFFKFCSISFGFFIMEKITLHLFPTKLRNKKNVINFSLFLTFCFYLLFPVILVFNYYYIIIMIILELMTRSNSSTIWFLREFKRLQMNGCDHNIMKWDMCIPNYDAF